MDKNTIIGLLLITAIIIGFTIYNRPSKEQIEAERMRRDSIAQVETSRAQSELPPAVTSDSSNEAQLVQGSNIGNFFSAGQTTQQVLSDSLTSLNTLPNLQDSTFQPSPAKKEEIVLENEKIRLVLNTLGGSIQSVQLKEHLRYTGDNLYLYEENEAHFNLDLFNRNSVRLSTEQEYFTPIQSADGKSVIMRLQNSPEQYIDFIYTLPADEYMMDFDIRVV